MNIQTKEIELNWIPNFLIDFRNSEYVFKIVDNINPKYIIVKINFLSLRTIEVYINPNESLLELKKWLLLCIEYYNNNNYEYDNKLTYIYNLEFIIDNEIIDTSVIKIFNLINSNNNTVFITCIITKKNNNKMITIKNIELKNNTFQSRTEETFSCCSIQNDILNSRIIDSVNYCSISENPKFKNSPYASCSLKGNAFQSRTGETFSCCSSSKHNGLYSKDESINILELGCKCNYGCGIWIINGYNPFILPDSIPREYKKYFNDIEWDEFKNKVDIEINNYYKYLQMSEEDIMKIEDSLFFKRNILEEDDNNFFNFTKYESDYLYNSNLPFSNFDIPYYNIKKN
jgi:hypothetical protein